MKNVFIALTALAGLFTQATASECQPQLKYCGKTINSNDCYKLVFQQWVYDTSNTQSVEDRQENLFTCQDDGTIKFERSCPYGCKTTPQGEDDVCIGPDPPTCTCVPVYEGDAAQKPYF